jgi:predicted oxidoreductase (fatty acid repression mutant protein)
MIFTEAMKNRRTIYGLGANIDLSDTQIKEIVEEADKVSNE